MNKRRLSLAISALGCLWVVGCGETPIVGDRKWLNDDPTSRSISHLSCAEQSARTVPLKHPLVELIKCIAKTDDLRDANHLFHKTLAIQDGKNYENSKNRPWGITVAIDNEINHLPKEIVSLWYSRVESDITVAGGRRYLGLRINSQISCIRLSNVLATFGEEFFVSTPPIIAPIENSLTTDLTLPSPLSKIPGLEYISPRLFSGHENGLVYFEFYPGECVRSITVQRDFDPAIHRQIGK